MNRYPDFTKAINHTFDHMRSFAKEVYRGKWQGIDVSKKPEMVAYEICHWDMHVPMSMKSLHAYQTDIKPNLPWADNHFMERVGLQPLNPGVEWANWPWGKSADKFRFPPGTLDDPGSEPIFDHTYMQRYWPKYAGRFAGGILPDPVSRIEAGNKIVEGHKGIYFPYGDLDDVVMELFEDQMTRQAILPVFFPEDTGRQGRKPCSISYHFMMNSSNCLDIFYHLRSCDLIRHFRDDIYLTVRLLLWVLDRLRAIDPGWMNVLPGNFVMYIGNLHCFKNDIQQLRS